MDSFDSPKKFALHHATETLNKILEGNAKTSLILRGCLAVASMMGNQTDKQWISMELSGYYYENYLDFIPSYRKFTEYSGSQSYKYVVKDPMHRIEHVVESKLPLNTWDEANGTSRKVAIEWCHDISQEVQDRCLTFLMDSITKLQYSGMITSLIDTIQNEVNQKITKINSEISSELQSIYNNLSGKTAAEWSNAANSCRRVLMILANNVYPPTEETYRDSDGKIHTLKEDDFMNRILLFIEKNNGNGFLRCETKILGSYFDNFREQAGKNIHSSQPSKFEVEQLVIHTYLIISEVIKLVKV